MNQETAPGEIAAGRRMSARPRAWSARQLLVALAVAILVPVLVFAGVLAFLYAERERERYETQVRTLARDILASVDREFAGIEASVQALSTSRSLKRGDFATFYRQAEETKGFNATNVVVRDVTGQQLLNTRLPFGAALPRTSTEPDRLAAASRRPAVSDLFLGATATEPVFVITAPVFAEGGGDIVSFVNMSLLPERVVEMVRQEGVPEGWTAGVLDRKGVIVARHPGQGEFLGRMASARFLQTATETEGFYEGANLEGVAVLTAYARSPRFGWTVTTSVPRSVVSAPLRRSLALLAALGVALTALSALVAIWFGRRLTGSIRALSRQAAALAGSETVRPVSTSLVEVNEVGAALAAAAAQRRAAEDALAEAGREAERTASERSAILEQLAEGVIVTDADGRIIFVNGAATRLHGVSRLDVEPGAYSETYHLFTLDGRPHPFEELPLARAVLKGETVEDGRWRIRRPDGTEVLAVGSARPVRGPDGTRLGSVLTLRDDTAREAADRIQQRLNEALAEQAAELLEANEEMQRYAYVVSHDLRAPLVNVMGFTSEIDALREDIRTALANDPRAEAIDRDVGEAIGFIKAAIAKMEGLIAAILKLSREGRRTMRPQVLDMPVIVQGLADAIRHQTETADATIEVAPDLPALTADRLAVEQIFGNLLDNAVKYLAPGRPGRIVMTGEVRGARAVYRVQDNGRGIAPHDHGRVFELFRRAGTQDRPGEGIGLAQVRATVRALGGRIELASQPGEGTTFTVTLPRQPTGASIEPTPPRRAPARQEA